MPSSLYLIFTFLNHRRLSAGWRADCFKTLGVKNVSEACGNPLCLDFGETWLWGRLGWLSRGPSWGLLGGGFARLALLGWGEKALLLDKVVLGLQFLWRKWCSPACNPGHPAPLAVGGPGISWLHPTRGRALLGLICPRALIDLQQRGKRRCPGRVLGHGRALPLAWSRQAPPRVAVSPRASCCQGIRWHFGTG